jgi:uncharacterized protein YgiM (DUF1202 family)
MKRFVVGSLLALVFLVSCGQDSSNKPKAVTESPTTRVRRSISEKPSQFVYAKMMCNIRRGPGTKYAVVRKATKGERLEYVSRRGNWYKLRVAKGKPQQWVHKSVVNARGE